MPNVRRAGMTQVVVEGHGRAAEDVDASPEPAPNQLVGERVERGADLVAIEESATHRQTLSRSVAAIRRIVTILTSGRRRADLHRDSLVNV